MLYAHTVVASRRQVQELTYAIPAAIIPYIRVGSTVTVPVRRQIVRGVVIKLTRTVPLAIRDRMKEIISIDRSGAGFAAAQIKTIEDLADYYAASLGEVAYHALAWPSRIESEAKSIAKKPIFVAAPWPERLKFYLQLRDKYKDKRRLVFLLPTTTQASHLREVLGGEILGDELTAAQTRELTRKLAENQPLMMVGVQKWVFLPLRSGDVLVVDSPESVGAKQMRRPYMTSKRIGLTRAKNEGIQLIMGADLLPVVDFPKKVAQAWRVVTTTTSIVPTTVISRHRSPSLLVEGLVEKLVAAEKQKNLVFVASRGFAPVLYCPGCQDVYRCPNCQRTVHLKNEAELACRFCGWHGERPKLCKYSKDELIVLGEGAKLISKEVAKVLPDSAISEVSSDTLNKPGNLTVATEKILSFSQTSFDNLFVVSADRFLSGLNPDDSWHLLSILLALKSRVKTIIIQTHFPEHWVWSALSSGNLQEYYQEEIAMRQKYRLPPFGQELIVFGRDPNRDRLEKQAKEIYSSLTQIKKISVSEPALDKPNSREYQAKITIYADSVLSTVDKKMIRDSLPPSWAVDVDA